MTVLLYVLGVLAIVVGLAVSIALHECGHMVPAKRFGVRVPQFFVGFGRTLWSTRRGETEYGIKSFPLGGFVKLIGMLPPEAEGKPGRETSTFGRIISDARSAERELLRPGDEKRMFYRLPWWKKVIVMAGGPTVNLVIAFLLFGALFWIHGVAETTTKVGSIPDCVVAIKPGQEVRTCTAADPVSPSKLAGIEVGDEIVKFGDTKITSYAQLSRLIRANPRDTVDITVLRDGKPLVLTATTQLNELPVPGGGTKTAKVGYLGITPTEEYVSKGPVYTLREMGDMTVETVKSLGALPQKLWGVAKAVVGQEDRDPESPQSIVGVSRVAGEVASTDKITPSERIATLVSILAAVNLFVGMFNFVPLLPLDGGHIAGALYEAVRRGLARLLRRRDPGHFDVAKLLPATYVTAGLLILMTLLLVVADLVAPVSTGL